MVRRSLLFALCGALLALSADAHTSRQERFTCPLDGTSFEARVDTSGTQFGTRLDLKPLGPTAAPWAVPVCPKCRLPLYKRGQQAFSDAERRTLAALVATERWRKASADQPSYGLIALVQEELGNPPFQIGFSWLRSSWQVEGEPSRYTAALRAALRWFDRAEAAEGKSRPTCLLLRGELRRQLGDFAEAAARFDSAARDPEMKAEPFPSLIAFERELIAAKEVAPREMPGKR